MTDHFENHVGLVTGAAQGLGAHIASELAARGARVALADVQPLDKWEHDLGARDDDGHSRHRLDVRDMASCESAVGEIADKHGRLDFLVNNAGVVARGMPETMSVDDFVRTVDVNLNGTFRVSKAAFGLLRETRGRIVNIGSTSGKLATPRTAPYCASKAGIHQLTSALALDWASYGIQVNAVAPIIVPTQMNADLRQSEQYLREKLARIPLARMGTEKDVSDAICYLLSSQSQMITGQTIYVDGGATFC